jgi:hypothetical protein
MPPFALVPAYLSQFPTSRSVAVVIMAGLGPPLFRIQMTMLGILLMNVIPGADLFFSCFLSLFKRRRMLTYGLTTQKANR